MNTIIVYVPKTYLIESRGAGGNVLPKPTEFWLSPPEGWSKQDLVTLSVTPETYREWTVGGVSGRQLLKD